MYLLQYSYASIFPYSYTPSLIHMDSVLFICVYPSLFMYMHLCIFKRMYSSNHVYSFCPTSIHLYLCIFICIYLSMHIHLLPYSAASVFPTHMYLYLQDHLYLFRIHIHLHIICIRVYFNIHMNMYFPYSCASVFPCSYVNIFLFIRICFPIHIYLYFENSLLCALSMFVLSSLQSLCVLFCCCVCILVNVS